MLRKLMENSNKYIDEEDENNRISVKDETKVNEKDKNPCCFLEQKDTVRNSSSSIGGGAIGRGNIALHHCKNCNASYYIELTPHSTNSFCGKNCKVCYTFKSGKCMD